MNEPVEAVFFDLDDTLIDDYESSRICIEQTCLEFHRSVPGFDRALVAKHFTAIGRAFWFDTAVREVEDDAARLPEIRTTNWSAALEASGIRAPGLGAELAASYGALRDDLVIAFDDVRDVLNLLHGRFRLGVITNGAGSVQRRKLEAAGLDRYFDIVLASTDIGAAKPEAVVFETALRGTGSSATSAWHIGDNLVADVSGAIGAGMSAAWLNRRGRTRDGIAASPHAEITTLRDLPGLLGLQ